MTDEKLSPLEIVARWRAQIHWEKDLGWNEELNIVETALKKQVDDEKKLKALEILKEKEVDIFILNRCNDVETYNDSNHQEIPLTQEEFDLLKKENKK